MVNVMNVANFCKNQYNFIYLETIDSTNTYAKNLCQNGAAERTVVISNEQTSGKGRLGRTFFSKHNGIYMSIILRPDFEISATQFITVAAAVATANAIDQI